MKILVIEDDGETAAYVARGLREHGHVVAVTGHEGLFLATGGSHDALVVDRMLPGFDRLGALRDAEGARLVPDDARRGRQPHARAGPQPGGERPGLAGEAVLPPGRHHQASRDDPAAGALRWR